MGIDVEALRIIQMEVARGWEEKPQSLPSIYLNEDSLKEGSLKNENFKARLNHNLSQMYSRQAGNN